MTKFSHTGKLEVYHALYNKWIPKSQHFSYLGMVTRSQLAIMDFTSGSDLEKAKTRGGKDRHVVFSKVTQHWQAKPIKDKKSRDFLFKLIDRTLEVIKEAKYWIYQNCRQICQNILHPFRSLIKEKLLKNRDRDFCK